MVAPLLVLAFTCVPWLQAQGTDGAVTSVNPKTASRSSTRPEKQGAYDRGRETPQQAKARALANAKAAAALAPAQGTLPVSPSLLPGALALGGGDDCGTPDVIVGTGTFAFDTTAATTSAQQQNCGGGCDNDVWFSWTAPSTGLCTYATCGGSGSDTVIAAWSGSGCGATPVACNDDSCGLQSSVGFPVLVGQSFMLQLGGYTGSVGTGTFSLNVTGPATNDDCSAAIAISGSGSYPFNTIGATTGTQQGLSCGTGNAYQDVWFDWTCPATGFATWTLCGSAGFDTLIAAYAGSACPVPGSALACNDDSVCGNESTLQFPCVAGAHYLLQLGAYSPGAFGVGTFALGSFLPPPNDDCNAPLIVSGLGSFPFDNTSATTGTQGQGPGACNFYGQSAIAHDVWFSWTSPGSGCTIVDTCGSTVDTKMAVYRGAGCPLLADRLACNDDSCGLQSRLYFTAVAGRTYTIQMGTFPQAAGGTGTFQITQLGSVTGNDDCAQATLISGVGVFPFNNLGATTGCEGQDETLCAAQYGQLSMENDIWFQWVAPATGSAMLDTCGLTTVDTKIAAYLGGGCPASDSALACTDDSCPGFQTTLFWNCTAGTTYTIQLGTFPSASGGPGQFSLQVLQPPTNDTCTAPVSLGTTTGTYPFALFGATTGTQGQTGNCTFGLSAIDNDIWYTWTAATSGRCTFSLCAGSSFDSKIKVYGGAGCPTSDAIACNDDACGLTSEVCFDVVGGQTYTLQLGTFPGAGNNFAGSFDLGIAAPLPLCTWDDGSPENLLTWTVGGDMVWLNRFGAPGTSTVVSSIDVMWGAAMFPGYNPASNGDFATDVFLWQDGPTQDGDPSDATLLLSIPTTVTVWDTNTYVSFPITPISIAGVFFVGSHQDSYGLSGAGPTQFVAPMDQDCSTAGVAWFFGNNSGFGTSPVDYANPSNNVQPPLLFQNIGLPCQVMVRAGCNAGPATYLCDPGHAPVIACPCSNPPRGLMRGCDNSAHSGGAAITASGSNTLSSPTLVFTTAGETPTATSMLLQGSASSASGLVFGQGVRCTAGVLRRLYVKAAVGGSIQAPNFAGGDLDIPARSSLLGDPLSAGQDRWYMVYYRDPVVLGTCSASSTFNTTNTARVHWRP